MFISQQVGDSLGRTTPVRSGRGKSAPLFAAAARPGAKLALVRSILLKIREITMKKLIAIAILTLGFFNVASSYAIDGPIPQCFPCTKW